MIWLTCIHNKVLELLKLLSKYFIGKSSQLEEQIVSSPYNALTPTSRADLKEYEHALLYALNNVDIRNIAITGPYGSGKSSILKTFESKYDGLCNHHFLNISLATFDKEEADYKTEDKLIKLNSDVEKSLLQQIFFKVTSDELEDSHFSRLRVKRYIQLPLINRSFLVSDLGVAFFLTAFISSIWFLSNSTYIISTELKYLFNQKYSYLFELFCLFSLVGLVQLVFNIFPKLGLNKFGAAGAEISFNERKGDSILNKFIDELTYFFSVTKYNTVVFEDLDRFPSLDIFIKLREINSLLNNADIFKRRNKPIKFIFVIGDDIFKKAEDRTKFFDFILPIIPVINSFNAEEQLRNAICSAFENHSVKQGFFEDVALFINDMRMLLNIANEFIIYKKMLDGASSSDPSESSKVNLDDTKLLALIIYKNKQPEDFKLLNYRKGYVAEVFENRLKILRKYASSLALEIEQFKETISQIEGEAVSKVEDLNRIYVGGYFSKLTNAIQLHFDGTWYTFNELITEEVFEKLITQTTLTVQIKSNYQNSVNIRFKDVEALIDSKVSYRDRRLNIQNTDHSRIDKLKEQILNLERRQERALSLKIKEIIDQLSDEELFAFVINKKPIDQDLLRYFIVNGYIEEDYDSYVSHFYPGELTINDKQFLISLANQNPLGFKFKLDSVEKVFDRIQDERYGVKAILNYDLVEYLLAKKANSKHLDNFLKVVLDNSEEGFVFVTYYLVSSELLESLEMVSNRRLLITKLAKTRAIFFRNLFHSMDNESEQSTRTKLLSTLLEITSIKDLAEINKGSYFTDLISSSKVMLEQISALGSDRAKDIISSLKVKFLDLESCSDLATLSFIEQLRAYSINKSNITHLLSKFNSSNQLKTDAGLTSILKSQREHLINYVRDCLDEYLEEIFLVNEYSDEDEATFIEILNSEANQENIINVIQTFKFKIIKIDSINEQSLWSALFENNNVLANWNNIVRYFESLDNSLDSALINYLNVNENSQLLSKVRLSSDVKTTLPISKLIIYSDELRDETYQYLIKSVPYWYPDLSDLEISSTKIGYLLYEGKFQLTVENYNFINSVLANRAYELIGRNISKFLEEPDDFELDAAQYNQLFNFKTLSTQHKVGLMKIIPSDFYDENLDLANRVSQIVTQESKEKVLTKDVVEQLICLDIAFDYKIKLFNRYATDFDIGKIKELISNIDLYDGLVKNKRPKVPNNPDNLEMVKFLVLMGFVSFTQSSEELKLNPKGKVIQ